MGYVPNNYNMQQYGTNFGQTIPQGYINTNIYNTSSTNPQQSIQANESATALPFSGLSSSEKQALVNIYAKNLELKLLIEQNSEIVEFMIPRMSDWYYKKAVFANLNNKKQEAYNYLIKSVEADSTNVMANYELAKISLDSFQVSKTTERLTRLLQNENLNKEESQLCKNLLAFTYDKNIITSLALVKEGKFSDAEDILLQLQSYCKNDILNICKPNLIEKNINICKNGIYKDHIKIAKTAVDKQKTKVAGDFLVNTYDYLQRNMGEITDTSDFDDIVKIVVGNYLATA
jgi:hypothetical protein